MNLRILGYTTLVLISAAILSSAVIIAVWIMDREVPVEVQATEVLTPEVQPGGTLLLRQRIDYIRDCGAHVDRAVYDTDLRREFLPDIDYNRPLLGLGVRTITFAVPIPEFFKAGVASYRAKPSYICNPLQKLWWPITRPETDIRFKIVDVAP